MTLSLFDCISGSRLSSLWKAALVMHPDPSSSTLSARLSHEYLACHLRPFSHICARSRTFDDLLDDVLNSIPIVCRHRGSLNAKKLCNLAQQFVAFLVMNEGNGNTDTTEPTCSANTVQVGFGIWSTVDLRDIL